MRLPGYLTHMQKLRISEGLTKSHPSIKREANSKCESRTKCETNVKQIAKPVCVEISLSEAKPVHEFELDQKH